MAAVLSDKNAYFLIQSEVEKIENNEKEGEEIISTWIKSKDMIQASTDITKLDKLPSGVYMVKPTREGFLYCKEIDIKSDDLFIFSDSITSKLLDEIELFWSKSEIYKQNKLIHKRGILLEGYPGTGKSSIISILSNKIIEKGGVVFKVNNYRNLDDYIDFIRTQFRKVEPDTPLITILEDIDQYDEVELELLDFLDGKTHLNHHLIISTTNNTELIPDTFLRPSRIDLKIEIPLPCEETRKEYFINKKVPEIDIEELVSKSNNFSLADLKELYICIYVLDYTIQDAIDKISSPRKKKNYLTSPITANTLGI